MKEEKRIWWKESVIYQIYPRSFKDSSGDGIGDIQGIISKLPYLKELGVDIIWLSPIFSSPNDDNGYDVADYCDIMSEFGSMDDFDALLAESKKMGLKIILDLVANHSSDEHRWFQESRKSKDNKYSDYYIWKDGIPNNWKAFFGGGAWDYDELRQQYYLHFFSKKQPDLNWENPELRKEMYKVMRFWMDKGIDGFRIDVIPLISKRQDYPDADFSDFWKAITDTYANGPRLHEFIKEMHMEVMADYDMMTVGEGPGVNTDNAHLYIQEDRDELNMIYHFDQLFIDHGPGGRFDIKEWTLQELKESFVKWDNALKGKGWINICLSNHDSSRLVSRFGNDKAYRTQSAKMLAILLLTLRGTPCIYQGCEIGMRNTTFNKVTECNDLEILNAWEEEKLKGRSEEDFLKAVNHSGRDNARTPMLWSNKSEAGFSEGTPWLRINDDYLNINVESNLQEKDSVFHFYKKMLSFRKENKDMVYADFEIKDLEHPRIFSYLRRTSNKEYLIVMNFSDDEVHYPVRRIYDYLIGNYENDGNTFKPWEGRVYLRS